MPALIPPTTWANHRLEWGQHTYVMGIVNVTPDSFSGDGLAYHNATVDELIARAIDQATRFVAEGATLLDLGGESTRPGFTSIPAEQELARVLPVLKALRATLPADIILSIDTYKAEVAQQALAAGADMLNDIWGLRYDPRMAAVAREHGVPVILMANMRPLPHAEQPARYEIVSDTVRLLSQCIDTALAAGIAWERILIDPGIGFGTTPEENITLLQRLGELRVLGRPILLGTSRKSTIGLVLGGLPMQERLEGTAATIALGIAQGADIVRVHDVRAMARVAKMSDALVRGTFTLTRPK
jgi:dihydropteroate synthase